MINPTCPTCGNELEPIPFFFEDEMYCPICNETQSLKPTKKVNQHMFGLHDKEQLQHEADMAKLAKWNADAGKGA